MVREAEGKSEIAAILNKYKDTLDDLIDSLDTESPDQPESSDWLGPIDKRTCNVPRSRGASSSLLEEEEDRLDKDVLVTLLKLAPKTRDSLVYKRHNVAPLGPKSRRVQYKEGQRGGEDGKDKKGGENRRGKRGGGGHRGNKVNSMVGESNGSEVSVYHHIIYQCFQRLIVLR